ncbi:MAG: hypothetical protein JKY65_04475 [Planctomycetes bacterium]|nr:hypothetical protein [Planctomycetota bacterium]
MSERILIVGAGAVGQVYGSHLQAGGAEVTLYLKPRHVEAAKAGFLLRPLGREKIKRLEPGPVVTSAEEVAAAKPFDQVWLCTSSTALEGAWLGPVLKAIGGATLIGLQPGLGSQLLLESHVKAEQVVMGMISLVAYQSPLPGGEDPSLAPAVAYWFPPLSPSPFSGPRGEQPVASLKRGGCPAKTVPDAAIAAATGSAFLMPHLVALELEGWKLAKLRRGKRIAQAADASREALEIVTTEAGVRRSPLRLAMRSWLTRSLVCAAPHVAPFPLEPYLEYHFTKVGDQTRAMIRRYVERGRAQGLPTKTLERILRDLLASSEGEPA